MRNDLYGRKPQSHGRVPTMSRIMNITDNDTALIIAVIFLLKKENRYPMLILALLYILT